MNHTEYEIRAMTAVVSIAKSLDRIANFIVGKETVQRGNGGAQKMGPLAADHPLVVGKPTIGGMRNLEHCPACQGRFEAGNYITLVAIGPGTDEENRRKARENRPYNAIAVPAHWACVTGEES